MFRFLFENYVIFLKIEPKNDTFFLNNYNTILNQAEKVDIDIWMRENKKDHSEIIIIMINKIEDGQ